MVTDINATFKQKNKNKNKILKQGIKPMGRQYVHLSMDRQTARNVGKRYGKPIILIVESGKMNKCDYNFYLSVNNVCLTYFVPPEYIRLIIL